MLLDALHDDGCTYIDCPCGLCIAERKTDTQDRVPRGG